MQSESVSNDEKNLNKAMKSFSNRNSSLHLPPYSHQFARAKQKAFERYKKIYPVQDKENIYPLTKTPNIGYYVMKGYKCDQSQLKESSQANVSQGKSSEKIVTHLLKKYLERKEHIEAKMVSGLPKIDLNGSVRTHHRTSTNIRLPKTNFGRVMTEYDERVDRSRRQGQ